MTVIETINRHLVTLPPERQAEALDFILFLKQRQSRPANRAKAQPVAFTAQSPSVWHPGAIRGVDALAYEQAFRAEWDDCP